MSAVKCGYIISVRLDQVSGNGADEVIRHAVVVSADIVNENLKTVLACPLVAAKSISRSRVGATFLPQDKIGLGSDLLALSLQIRTISKERIVKRVSSLPRSYMSQIKESLKAVLDLDSLPQKFLTG